LTLQRKDLFQTALVNLLLLKDNARFTTIHSQGDFMSEDGFHVHGADEHEVEHAAHRGEGLAQYVAIFTAILSTIGAIVSYQGGSTQNESMLYKNEAVLKRTEASDQWNFYQAKSSKGHLMELAADIAPGDKRDFYRKQIDKYEQVLHPHHRLAQGMTLIQIAISLASITALTRKRWLFSLAAVAAVGGIALAAMAWLS
jgi:hypothetical protein